MFAALWLLGSMVLDYLTPKELTVYMIAAATAPAVIGTGLSYYLRFPKIDFVLILATLWLVAALTIEWISPVPLPSFLIGAALAPALIVGAILHWAPLPLRRAFRFIELHVIWSLSGHSGHRLSRTNQARQRRNLLRRDLPRCRRRVGEIGRQLRISRLGIPHRFLLHRPVAADAIRQREQFDRGIQRQRRKHR
jgi:hypothetical protein